MVRLSRFVPADMLALRLLAPAAALAGGGWQDAQPQGGDVNIPMRIEEAPPALQPPVLRGAAPAGIGSARSQGAQARACGSHEAHRFDNRRHAHRDMDRQGPCDLQPA